ncbi:AAA family ATPase [Mycobacterium sp. SMC-8]|nr:AAA family ATPase [Mycobacterium sp. SMC-8]
MVDGHWLDRQDFPPLEWSVEGIVPEGLILLVAPPKAGKSWLVAGLGLACQSGGVALGRIRVGRRPVLYLALEDGYRRLQSRFRRLLGESNPIPAISLVTSAKALEVVPMMTAFLERHQGQKPLIILDTLGKVRPPRPAGADAYSVDYAIGSQLKAVIDSSPGASMLLVHHSRKAESPDFVDSVSGTQGIAGSVDAVLVLNRKRHSDEAILSITGRDVEERELALKAEGGVDWRLDGSDLSSAARTAQSRRESASLGERTLEVLSLVDLTGKITPHEVAEKLGIENKAAGQYLARLAKEGRIEKGTRGVYHSIITEESEETEENAGQVVSLFPHASALGEETTPGEETETDPHQSIPHIPRFHHSFKLCGCGADLKPENTTGLCAECSFIARQSAISSQLNNLENGHGS